MALDFPNSPVDGQQFTSNNITWVYSSSLSAWRSTDTRVVIGSSLNNQILYNSGNAIAGSNGITFNASSNTIFTNTVNVSQNVYASFYYGDGSKLTGIVTDFSPAFNQANTANATAIAAFTKANAALVNATATFSGNLTVTGNVVANGIRLTTSPFFEAIANISYDYNISSGYNAMSPGPITINSGVSVNVPSGSVWTIV